MSNIKLLNGSNKKEKDNLKLPTEIQSNNWCIYAPLSPASRQALTSPKSTQLIKNETSTTPLPMIPIRDLGNIFCPKPLIRKPTKGNKGINQISSFINKYLSLLIYLPTQFAQRLQIYRFRISVHHDDNSQSHSNLCRGQRHDKKHKYLSTGISPVCRESSQ